MALNISKYSAYIHHVKTFSVLTVIARFGESSLSWRFAVPKIAVGQGPPSLKSVFDRKSLQDFTSALVLPLSSFSSLHTVESLNDVIHVSRTSYNHTMSRWANVIDGKNVLVSKWHQVHVWFYSATSVCQISINVQRAWRHRELHRPGCLF